MRNLRRGITSLVCGIILSLFLCVSSFAADSFTVTSNTTGKYDYYTYFVTTGAQITVEWLVVSNAKHYEVQIYNIERKEIKAIGITGNTEMIFSLSRTGHYAARVRAVNDIGASAWSESTDPTVATVDGTPRGWWLYGYLAPPGPIIIK